MTVTLNQVITYLIAAGLTVFTGLALWLIGYKAARAFVRWIMVDQFIDREDKR